MGDTYGHPKAAKRGRAVTPDAERVELRLDVKIPLRDGVNLSATLYLPKDQLAPAPGVVTLTPYVSDTSHVRGVYCASHGLPFVAVDVRGRGNSEGKFQPFIQEAADGYDVVEWVARQTFCDGKVAMLGGSYHGYAQWATAKEFPPHLATIVPVAAPYMGVDFPMRSNISYPYLMQWFAFTAGRASQMNIFVDRALWSSAYHDWHRSGRPFKELDTMLCLPSAVFQEWLRHPAPDEYWEAYNPRRDEYARIEIPILTITGSYDDDQLGALRHYREHVCATSPDVRARHCLVIGPWDHAGTRTPLGSFGGLSFGPESLIDLPQLHIEWYRWTMLGGDRPRFLRKAVAYYVMGKERWRYADSLDEITAQTLLLSLDSVTNANDVFSSGSLSDSPGRGGPDWYIYDPRDVGGIEVEAEAHADGGSLTDQTMVLALRGRALVYHSVPFDDDVEISGFFRLSVWIAIDCPDADLYVAIYEICLDGTSVRLSNDAIRARYREGLRTEKLIRTLEPLHYVFDRFTFVSREIRRGHCLRLVISSVGRLVETTFAQKNYNSGGVVSEESVNDGRPVTISLFHDGTRESVLQVPLGRTDLADEVEELCTPVSSEASLIS